MVSGPTVSELLIGIYYCVVLFFTVFELGYLFTTFRNSAQARSRKIKSTFLGWDKNNDEINYLWFRNLRILLALALISQGTALFVPVFDTLFEAFVIIIIMRFTLRVVSLNARYYDESTSAHYFGRAESGGRNSNRSTSKPNLLSCDRCLDLSFCTPYRLQTDAPFWMRLVSVIGLFLYAVLRPLIFFFLVFGKGKDEKSIIEITNYCGQTYLSVWCLTLFIYLLRVRYNSVEKYMFSLNTTVTHSFRNQYYFMRSIQRISRMVVFSLVFSLIFVTRAVMVGAGVADETVKSSGFRARWHKLRVGELAVLILASVIVNFVLIILGLLTFLTVRKDGVSASLLYPSEARMEKEASDIANLTWKMSFKNLLPGEYDLLEPDTHNLRLLSGVTHEDDSGKAMSDDIDLLTAIGLQNFAGDLNPSADGINGKGKTPISGGKRTETEMHYLDVNRGYAAPSISSVKLSMSEMSDSSFDPVMNAPLSGDQIGRTPASATASHSTSGLETTSTSTSSTALTKKTTMSDSRSVFLDPFAALFAPKINKGSPNSSFRSEASSKSTDSKSTTLSDASVSISAAQRSVHPKLRKKYTDDDGVSKGPMMRAHTDRSAQMRKDIMREKRHDTQTGLSRAGTDRSAGSAGGDMMRAQDSPSGLRFERKADRPPGKRMKRKLFERRKEKTTPLPALNPISSEKKVSYSSHSTSVASGYATPDVQRLTYQSAATEDSDMFAGLEFDRGLMGSEATLASQSTSRRTDTSLPMTREHPSDTTTSATSVHFAGYPARPMGGPPPAPAVQAGYMFRPGGGDPTTLLKDRSGAGVTRPVGSTVPARSVSPIPPPTAMTAGTVSAPYGFPSVAIRGASPSPGPPVPEERVVLPQAKPITADFGAGLFPKVKPMPRSPPQKTETVETALDTVSPTTLKITPASRDGIYDTGPSLSKNFFERIDAKSTPVPSTKEEVIGFEEAAEAVAAASPSSLSTPRMLAHRQHSTATTLLDSEEDESEWMEAIRRESGLQPTSTNPFKALERDHLEKLRELEEIEKRRGMSTATINQHGGSLLTAETELSESRDAVLPMIIAGQSIGIPDEEARRGLRTLSEHSHETSTSAATTAWTTTTLSSG